MVVGLYHGSMPNQKLAEIVANISNLDSSPTYLMLSPFSLFFFWNKKIKENDAQTLNLDVASNGLHGRSSFIGPITKFNLGEQGP